MRIAVDETTTWVLPRILQRVFGAHTFESTTEDLQLSGTLDPALIDQLSHVGFDLLLTADTSMIEDHREELRDSGMHWVGISQVQVPGEAGLAFLAGSALAALPLIFDEISSLAAAERRAFRIKRLGTQPRQRYSVVGY